ncbi:hypothetical protein VTN77DRAFT_7691 [Rasamsonia byssochlamydoides]|uniref:uncharacterized protein n=1 Tax=Rasamsonia byssochlamydoides TaxID=89139 RepID=UPI003742FE4E
MPASEIPNLNTLRRGGGGRGRLLRGRGGSGVNSDDRSHNHHQTGSAAKDRVVQGTDNDASVSRLSAVELGYLDDPFARILTAPSGHGTRRFPIINRGTYVRTAAIDNLVHRFLDEPDGQPPKKKQIISLGAGSDTRVFRLFAKRPSLQLVYHELDFPVNTAAKIRVIRSTPLLQGTLHISSPSSEEDVTISAEGDALHSPFYHIHPIDLRSLAKPPTTTADAHSQTSSDSPSDPEHSSEKNNAPPVLLPGVDTSLPTLLISECCLVYLSPEDAAGVVDYFTKTLFPRPSTASADSSDAGTPLGLILYEPIRPDDPFGKTMVSNLAARGIQLQTLHRYASLDAQRQRLRDHGFDAGQGAADVDFIWENWVSEAEKERVARLEMLDEVEEWKLLAQHYCVAWGWIEGAAAGVFDRWKDVQAQSTS